MILKDIANNPDSKYRPEDDQDQCYMNHDICYGNARIDCKKDPQGCHNKCVNRGANKCDDDLTKCLINIGLSGNPLKEARRIIGVPVFIIQPGVRNAVESNKEAGTSKWLEFRF